MSFSLNCHTLQQVLHLLLSFSFPQGMPRTGLLNSDAPIRAAGQWTEVMFGTVSYILLVHWLSPTPPREDNKDPCSESHWIDSSGLHRTHCLPTVFQESWSTYYSLLQFFCSWPSWSQVNRILGKKKHQLRTGSCTWSSCFQTGYGSRGRATTGVGLRFALLLQNTKRPQGSHNVQNWSWGRITRSQGLTWSWHPKLPCAIT